MRKTAVFVATIISMIVCIVCTFMYMYIITAQLDCFGFGIDSSGILYIGFSEKIVKFQNGEKVGLIRPPRGYAFEILEDDTILCSDGQNTYIEDLNGNVLEVRENTGSDEYYRILREKRSFVASDGQVYEMRMPFGRRIIKSQEGKVIWEASLRDYLVCVVGFLSIVIVMGCAVIIIYHLFLMEDWKL